MRPAQRGEEEPGNRAQPGDDALAWRRCGLGWAAEEPRGRALAWRRCGLGWAAEEPRGRALAWRRCGLGWAAEERPASSPTVTDGPVPQRPAARPASSPTVTDGPVPQRPAARPASSPTVTDGPVPAAPARAGAGQSSLRPATSAPHRRAQEPGNPACARRRARRTGARRSRAIQLAPGCAASSSLARVICATAPMPAARHHRRWRGSYAPLLLCRLRGIIVVGAGHMRPRAATRPASSPG